MLRNVSIILTLILVALALAIVASTGSAHGTRATIDTEDLSFDEATTGDPFSFVVNVTGDIAVRSVHVEYWFGTRPAVPENRTMTGENLTGQAHGTYRYAMVVPSDMEEHLNYTFKVRDNADEWHTGAVREVPVLDNDDPVIGADDSDDEAFTGNPFHFEITATDNIGISHPYVIYDFNGLNSKTLEMVKTDTNTFVYDGLVIPTNMRGVLSYRFHVQDASDNWAPVMERTLPIKDDDDPTIGKDLTDRVNVTKGLPHVFATEAFDNIEISIVKMEYWFGLGVLNNENMSKVSGHFSVEIPIPRFPSGDMYYRFLATDLDGNVATGDTNRVTPINRPPEIDPIPPWALTERQEATLDLSPYISDANDPLGSLVVTCLSPPTVKAVGHCLVANYTIWWQPHTISFCMSDGEDSVNGTISATVRKVPVITSTPVKKGKVNETYNYQLRWELESPAAIPRLSLPTRPEGMTVSSSGLITWRPTREQHDLHEVRVLLEHGGLSTSQRWWIDVDVADIGDGNRPPEFSGQPPRDALPGELFECDLQATDPDGDRLYFHLLQGPAGATLVNATGHMEWTVPYPRKNISMMVPFRVEVTDGYHTVPLSFSVRVRFPADRPPEIVGNVPDVSTDGVFKLDLSKHMSDPDDPLGNLTWRVEGADEDLFSAEVKGGGVLIVTANGDVKGSSTIRLVLEDPSGLSDDVTISVEVFPIPIYEETWFLPLLLAVLVGVAVAAVAVRRARARAPTVAVARRPADIVVDGGDKAVEEAPAIEERPLLPYMIEQVFVVYNDGRLITECAREECRTQDTDLMSGMLIAIQGLIQDGLQRGGTLESIKYGENLIMMTKGEYIILSAVIYGLPDEELRGELESVVHKIEGNHAGVIEEWTGDVEVFSRMHQMITPLLYNTAHMTREDIEVEAVAEEIALLSAIDFFQGYVRLKVAAVNTTHEAIMDTSLEVYYNSDLLRLERIEPETMQLRGDRVHMGNIKPEERTTVAFLFDPQICQESHIDGTLAYYDTKGELKHIQMKRRAADVVCPIFFTRENANTAMLRRLIRDELHLSDMRVFRYPKDLSPHEVLRMGKASIGGDVQKVSEFIVDRPKFEAEVWYFGETKVKGYRMVMRLGVIQDKGIIEFFAASTAMEPITGLLAEFRRELDRRLAERMPGEGRMRVAKDESLRRELAERELMLDREAGDDEGGEEGGTEDEEEEIELELSG